MADYIQLTRQLMPWLPTELAEVFANAWSESGDPELALAEIRADPRYDTYFPGNKRSDGSIYLDEQQYLATTEGYGLRFAQFGLGGDFMRENYAEFVQAGLSPNELEERLGQLYTEVISRGDIVRQYFSENYGTGSLSDRAIFASALNPEVSPLVYERQFRSAQVGGEASRFGFDIQREEAERLFSFGLDQEAARRLYGMAAQQLPTLRAIQQRFADPNDPLDEQDFADAVVINDPQELLTLNRLVGQEAASFANVGVSVDQMGRLRGLRRFGV